MFIFQSVVLLNVSHVAQIDYSLVADPKFDPNYMDVPLKVRVPF